jgi:Holliday junction resolvase|tara:strand:- start:9777 stop:10160 length:384 start_codon:yes stop_codon:yes gene_type:complete
MPKEAQLWKLLRDNVPSVHWQRIETGMTGAGVPDVNGCLNGKEVWIELKYVVGRKLGLRPMQISWLASRTRHGGDCYVLARKDDCIKLWLVVDLEQLKSLTWDSPAVIELQSPFQWALLLEMFPGKS